MGQDLERQKPFRRCCDSGRWICRVGNMVFAGALLSAAFLLSSPSTEARQGSGSNVESIPSGVVAIAGDQSVRTAEFDAAVLIRYSGQEILDSALEDLSERLLLAELIRQQGIDVDDKALEERFAQLDAQARAQGAEGGLRAELERGGIPLALFRDRLRLQLGLERLVRLDLNARPDRAISDQEQQAWLDAQLKARGIRKRPRPWTDGIAATVGDEIPVLADAWSSNVQRQVASEELRELAFQLLLAKAVRKRLPDLSDEGVDAAIADEVARRKAVAEADPTYQGVAFERLLEARGLTIELLARDPAVRVAGLSTWFVDQAQGEAGLRETYEAERDWFEDRYGEAVRARILYLVAAPERGPLTPRTFADAEEVARGIAAQIGSEADFERLCRTQSEDPLSRERGGDLGFVLPASENVPAALRDEIFLQHGAGRAGLVGPIRLDNGVALLWLGQVRPSPDWSVMRDQVHRELRRRFLAETLPAETIRTVFDPAPVGR